MGTCANFRYSHSSGASAQAVPAYKDMDADFLAGALPEDTLEAKTVGEDAARYWQDKAMAVKEGTTLVAKHIAPIFESPTSHTEIGVVPAGGKVVAKGAPELDQGGYLIVPISPRGAVELLLFRGMGVPMPEEGVRVGVLDGTEARDPSDKGR